MASTRWTYVAIAVGLGLLASTAACERDDPAAAAVGDAAALTVAAPVTSLVTVTTLGLAVPRPYVEDCVEYVQFAASIGEADMVEMWDAAAHSRDRLRENCRSLGRADPDGLAAISRRRDALEAFFGASSTTTTAVAVTSSSSDSTRAAASTSASASMSASATTSTTSR